MLNIRTTQLEAFEGAARQAFEFEMLEHLRQFSPPLVESTGDSQMRVVISHGLAKAEQFGFTYRGPVRLYLELMLLFGSYFDTDPQYAWLKQSLIDGEFDKQMERAEKIYTLVVEYRQAVIGPKDENALCALKKIQHFARQKFSIQAHNLTSDIMREMKQIYPQKAEFVGDIPLVELINSGVEMARLHKLTAKRSTTLVILLMYAFGHGCVNDPLYPWIGRTLNDEKIVNSQAKSKRLEKKSLTWLSHVLSHFEEQIV